MHQLEYQLRTRHQPPPSLSVEPDAAADG
jgi:hypothetical protein